MKEKIRLYFDALLYGDSVTKRYLYGIVFFTISTLVLGILAVIGLGIVYGFSAVLFAIVDLIWWQSMTLTSDELEKQGSKESLFQKKEERKRQKLKEKVEKKEKKKLAKEMKEVEKRQKKIEEEASFTKKISKGKKDVPYTVTKEEVKYILKKSRVKKDHREVIIDHCDRLNLKESPAYLWKDRKKYYLLVLEDEKPLKLDYPLSYDTVLMHVNGVKSEPSKEYKRFQYPSFISLVFEPFLPDYYEKKTMTGSEFCKNLYCLGEDMYFTNNSAKNVLEITGADFRVSDEITREDAHGEDFVNVYKANILWRDGVLSSNEYKDRITYLLGNLARADVGWSEFNKILTRMYEYNLITKAYVEFYLNYRKKRIAKNKGKK